MMRQPSIAIDLTELSVDPYSIFERIRAMGGVAWIEPLDMWYVTAYQDVRKILLDDEHYSTGTEHSLLYDTFGTHMLTSNGIIHQRARAPFRGAFAPAAIRNGMAEKVAQIADQLIDGLTHGTVVDLRSSFAARLPILTILALFGFSQDVEPLLRDWYDRFEKGLSNFAWDSQVRDEARRALSEFRTLFARQIESARVRAGNDLLSDVVHDQSIERLTDEEIVRNASIIFFGGISTVEALLLNTLYASALHAFDLKKISVNTIGAVIDETMRWLSPVQSATRHVVKQAGLSGVSFAPGDTVNCMLGAANRDPTIFQDADCWNPYRRNVGNHLGFATGAHFCLGSHLAKLEVRTAILKLYERCAGLTIIEPENVLVRGFEFRRPNALFASI